MKQQEQKSDADELNMYDEAASTEIPVERDANNADAQADASAANLAAYVTELQAELKQSKDMIDRLQTVFQQKKVELERETAETRARLKRTSEERLETSKGEIYQRLLDVADNLERAIKSAEAGADRETLLAGVRATYTLLLRQLEVDGVSQIEAEGEPFDPALHEAVDTAIVPAEQAGRVVAVYKPGYRIGARMLRPAAVQVGKHE
jgi:molecular chaperone GrpE